MTEIEKAPSRWVAESAAQHFLATLPFRDRGLTDGTVRTLIDCRIDAPERLLFMTHEQIKAIPGVDKASLAEIAAYRARFIPGSA
jgi:hypothetical protein